MFSLFAATFKQVAKTVTDVNLRDNVVDVVYKMFDENGKATNLTCVLIRTVAWMKWMSGWANSKKNLITTDDRAFLCTSCTTEPLKIRF